MSTDEMTFKVRQYSGLSEEQVSWVLRITLDEYCYWISGKKLAMRLRHRFGVPVAHCALNRYLAVTGARPGLLMEYARELGGFSAVRVAVDVASAR